MKTRMTELFEIKYPIMCGGMGRLCLPMLCAAISNAGGLGNITASCFDTGDDLRNGIKETRKLTKEPFSVNITMMPSFRIGKDMHKLYFDICFEERVPAIEVSGAPLDHWLGPEYMEKAHKAGTQLIHKVGSVKHAKHAEKAGYAAVIAAGIDEGGHPLNDDVGTMTLVPRVVESVKIPVIATGGIADGRGLAAALALGADGIMMASRFINTTECKAHSEIKQQLIERQEYETTLYGKTTQLQGRALKNAVVTEILEVEARHGTLEDLQPLLDGTRQAGVWEEGLVDAAVLPVGQSIGLIKDVVSCEELLDRIMKEAEESLNKAGAYFES
jgi:NAD(P)H-dependent flavin oxidoreductase YrpB (nitropropane dioxygenase family)